MTYSIYHDHQAFSVQCGVHHWSIPGPIISTIAIKPLQYNVVCLVGQFLDLFYLPRPSSLFSTVWCPSLVNFWTYSMYHDHQAFSVQCIMLHWSVPGDILLTIAIKPFQYSVVCLVGQFLDLFHLPWTPKLCPLFFTEILSHVTASLMTCTYKCLFFLIPCLLHV